MTALDSSKMVVLCKKKQEQCWRQCTAHMSGRVCGGESQESSIHGEGAVYTDRLPHLPVLTVICGF